MPRVSKAQAERNRAEIERVSTQMVLEHGLSVSLADVMAAAGLTHGGFYKHFRSKDEMTTAACDAAFTQAMETWQSIADQSPDPDTARAALVKHYLLPSQPAESNHCPMVSLAIDVSRSEQESQVRQTFSEGVEKLVAIFSTLQTPVTTDDKAKREQALLNIALLVGARVLAQATQGQEIANELREVSYQALSGHLALKVAHEITEPPSK